MKKVKNKIYKNSGISMIALVVTIIVLIILAGISISQISGNEGILVRAGNTKIATSIAQMEEEVNTIYINLLKDYDDPTLEEIKDELREKGYTVKRVSEEGSITGISLNKKNIDLYFGETSTVKVTYKMSGKYRYYVEINGNDYEMTLEDDKIKLSNESKKVQGEDEGELTAVSDNEKIKAEVKGSIIIITDIGNDYTTGKITVKYGSFSEQCNVNVLKKISINDDISENDIWFEYSSKNWTNSNVTVKANTKITKYTLQTSKDGITYNVADSQEFSENGIMYARFINGRNYSKSITAEVTNIDKEKPKVTSVDTTTNSLTITATDDLSGIIGYVIKDENKTPRANEWNNIAVTKTFNKTENGLKQNTMYYVWFKDQAGNISEVLSKQTEGVPVLVKDATVKFVSDPANWTNQDVTVTVTTTEKGYTLQTSQDGKTWESKSEQTFKSNGTIYARLYDGTNVGGAATGNVTNIDKNKPTISALSATTNSITINAEDDLSGINAYAVKIEQAEPTNDEWEAITPSTTNLSQTVERLTQNTTYYVWVKDRAGNISVVSSKKTESVPGLDGDKNPNVTFKSLPSGWTNEKVTVTATTTITGYTLQTKGPSGKWESVASQEFEENGEMQARLYDGTNVGGVASFNVTNIDTEDPKMTNVTSTTSSITMTAEDDLSGIDRYVIKEKNSTPSDSEWIKITATKKFSVTVSELTQNTKYYMWVKDQAGNISATSSKTTKTVPGLNIDPDNPDNPGTPENPIVKFTSSITDWTNKKVTVTAEVRDVTEYTLQTKKDNEEWKNVSLQDFTENGTMQARLTDGTNNGVAIKYDVTNIDTKSPIMANVTSTTSSITMTATDDLSGINGYVIKTEQETPSDNEWTTVTATNNFTITISKLTQNKKYYMWLKDQAGNVSERSSKTTTSVPGVSTDPDNPDNPGTVEQPNVKFTSKPSGWTSENVIVTASMNISTGFTLQTRKNNESWSNSTSQIFEENGTMQARLTDETNVGGVATFNVTNIDTNSPIMTNVTSTTSSITMTATDDLSGINGYVIKTTNTAPTSNDWVTVTPTKKFNETINNLKQNTKYYMWLKDQVGNISGMSSKTTTGVPGISTDPNDPDNPGTIEKPIVKFTSKPSEWTKENVTVTASMNISTGFTLQTRKSDGSWSNATSQTFDKNGTMEARLTDGTNVGGVATFNVTNIDTEAPTVAITAAASSNSIGITGTDNLSGINGYIIKGENVTPKLDESGWVSVTPTKNFSIVIPKLTAGTTYYVWLKDQAGNISRSSSKETESMPSLVEGTNITFTQSTSNWTNKDVTVTISTTESGYTLQTKKDNGSWTTDKTYTLTGNAKIYARLTDNQNYSNEVVKSITNIDKEKPVVTSVTATTSTLKITATDNASGIVSYAVTTGNTEPASNSSDWKTVSSTTSLSTTVNGLTQNKQYYVWVKDQAGNVSESTTKSTAKTSTIPSLVLNSNVTFVADPPDWTSGNVTVTANVTDEVKGNFTVQTRVGETGNWENKTTQTVSTNGTKVYVRLYDETNYGGTASMTVTNIDKENPTITGVTATTSTLKITATDDLSGIIAYAVTTEQTSSSSDWKTLSSGTKNFTTTIENLIQNKTYYIWVKDQAGHISAVSSTKTGIIPNLTDANITFTYNPSEKTTGSVIVTASTTVSGYTLQTSKDGDNWLDTESQTFTENGTIYARLTDGFNYGGMATASVINIVTDRSGIQVGDYVDYSPDSANSYSKSKLSVDITGSSSNSSDLTQEKLDWQILRIYDNGSIDLIGSPTNKDVFFTGSLGYNNGVYVMNDICESLYSRKSKGVTARSVNLEDLEKWLTPDGLNTRNTYSKTIVYGESQTYTGSNSYKPDIYEKAKSVSDPYYSKPTTNTYTGGSSSSILKAKQSYYNIEINNKNYGEGEKALNTFSEYWVASRYAHCLPKYVDFGLNLFSNNYISGYRMCYSFNYDLSYNAGLRPVVTLNPNIRITPCTGTNSTSNMHTINWPQYSIKFTFSTSEKTKENVTVTAEDTSNTEYTMQTSKDGKNWSNTSTQTFTENGSIYARLTDGTKYYGMATASVTNIDKDAPTATIKLSDTKVEVGKIITANVVLSDIGNSGIKLASSKWIYNTTSSKIGTDASKYTNTFTKTTEDIYLFATIKGTYYLHILVTDNAGNSVEIISDAVTVEGNTVTPGTENPEKTEISEDDTGYRITIPEGYKIADDSGTTISEGIVIEDKSGNQFVWVPVPNPIANSESEITTMVNNNQYPIAVKTGSKDSNGNTAYRGVLYDFTSSKGTVSMTARSYDATSGYREPAYLTDPDYGDASTNGKSYLRNIVGMTQKDDTELKTAWTNQMQNEFDDMVEKVSSAGGYYISRYEMSGTIDSSTGAISTESKPNATAFTGYTIYKNDYLRWYGLYKAGKSYTHSGITSTMIWGSQYDQMLIWMAKTGTDVTQTSSNKNTSKTITGVPGSQDIINKIYDIYGAHIEWTLEAYNTDNRALRGGSCDDDLSIAHIAYNLPVASNFYSSSRLALYVEPIESKDIPTLTDANISFKYNPSGQTTGSVTVTASTTITGYTLQTSKNGEIWSNSATQTFTENGTMYARLTDGKNYGGMATASVTNIIQNRSGIKVGDYVDYIPDSASDYSSDKLSSKITGSTENGSLPQETLSWQVLRIYDDGSMDLIGSPTSNTLSLSGALGYNNGVYVMNDVCKNLYSKPSKGVTARSVKLEDIESWMTAGGISYRNSFVGEGGIKYGETKTYTGDNTYKPDIYGKAKNNSDPYYTEPTTNTGAKSLSSDGKTYELNVKQTFYTININSNSTDYYGDGALALCGTSSRPSYCLATRYSLCYSNQYAYYGLYVINSYAEDGEYRNDDWAKRCGNRLRPVVTLNSNTKVIPCTGTNSASNMHTIDWPQYNIKFTYSTSFKTSESVTVTAEDASNTGYTLQTSKDGKNWSNTTKQTFTENGSMYARLTDGKKYYGMATASVTNIVTVTPGTKYNEKTEKTEKDTGYKITIPAGYTIADDSGTTISEGIVIEDESGNQFVWVPVPNATANSETELTTMVNSRKYPMAVKTGIKDSNGRTAYRGVLYSILSKNEIGAISSKVTETTDDGTVTYLQYREPSYLTDTTDGDASTNGIKYLQEIVGINKTGSSLQSAWANQMLNEYDEMVENVATTGGYYISRYEMSGTANYTTGAISTESKPNAKAFTPMSRYNNQYYFTWYGLYKAGKSYTHNGVGSSMIWGSQYDQMMLWMEFTGNDITNIENSKLNKNSTLTGVSGSNDIINKVYDLYGGRAEWTLEALNTSRRVARGATSQTSNNTISLNNRQYVQPLFETPNLTSRIAMYVK